LRVPVSFWLSIRTADPGFISRDDTSEIVDLKFVELREKFPRNLDPFQFVAGGAGVRNPLEVYPPQVTFLRSQALHDILVKRQDLCNILLRWIWILFNRGSYY
jgi:hypothetical protein